MNSLTIPPSPNWYEASILACAPDNTLIYGSRNDIVVIRDAAVEESADVKIICRAHSQKIISVNVNKNWGQPNKLFVTVAEDKIIKLWNAETMQKVSGHNQHIADNKVIGATFAGDERVISVSDDGIIVVWNTSVNQTSVLKDIFGSKVGVTCISTCPHASWLTAFGLKTGLVVVCDLRKQGKVLYKLRGHDKTVISLAWCPAPVNIFPKDPHNYVGLKNIVHQEGVQTCSEDIKNTGSKSSKCEDTATDNLIAQDVCEVNDKPQTRKYNKKNVWSNLIHADDDEITHECNKDNIRVDDSGGDDFLKECDLLLKKITNLTTETFDNHKKDTTNTVKDPERIILKAKKSQQFCKGDKEEESDGETCHMNSEVDLTTPETNNVDKSKERADAGESIACSDEVVIKVDNEEKSGELVKEEKSASVEAEVKGVVSEEELKNGNKTMAEFSDTDRTIIDENAVEQSEKVDSITKLCMTYAKECLDDGEAQINGKFIECTSSSVRELENKVLKVMVVSNGDGIMQIKEKHKEHKPSIGPSEKNASHTMDETNGQPSLEKEVLACEKSFKPFDGADDLANLLYDDKEKLNDEANKCRDLQVNQPEIENIVLKTVEVSTDGDSMETEEKQDGYRLPICKNEVVIESCALEARPEIPRNISLKEEPRKEFLLASSAKEGNIYIWRAGTDGRMQTFFNVTNSSNHRKSRRPNPEKLWITLCWVTPTMLLSSSKTAELIQWTLPKPKDNSKHFRLIHNDHNSLLFSIAAPITILNEHNWLNETKTNAWTMGQDRYLLNTSLGSDRKNLACYPTMGRVECFALSPLDPTRLAIGSAEGTIKIWELSRPHLKCIVMTNFYQKIQSKVVTLAWHPTNELLLAYGTLEGRIGYMDISNKSKVPTVIPNFFKAQIHNLEWGPINGNRDNLGLYAAGEGKLVIFNTKSSVKEPMEVDTPDNTYIYNFAWKPDYTMMVVSTKAGAVIVYSMELKIIRIHYFQHKLHSIVWHPNAVASNLDSSKYSCCFSAISNSTEVNVYDFGTDSDNKDDLVIAKYKSNAHLISSTAWSPHEANKLVISSEGIAQVWDVESTTVLSTFINSSFEGSTSVVWSPLDPDYIILASKDHTIRIWKVSDYPKKTDIEISALRKKVMKEISKECTDLLPKVEKIMEESPKVKKVDKNSLLPSFYSPNNAGQVVDDLRHLLLWKESLSNGEVGKVDNKPDILKVFGSSADMLNIVDFNQTIHKEKGKYKLGNILSLFKGDISTTIKEAIDMERVDPWIVMMAPLVSPKLWRRACEIYAVQLSQEVDSDPLEVATYYLACHKVQEAINELCEGALYREALALAKCRLLESDTAITEIMEKWAKYSLAVGNFEIAAQCNIFLGSYEQAASILFRRCDVDILEFAVELAEKSGNQDLCKAVQFRYNSFKNASEGKGTELPSKTEAGAQNEPLENGEKNALVSDVGFEENKKELLAETDENVN